MARPVPERPAFPQAIPPSLHGIITTYGSLVKAMLQVFGEYGFRLNRALPKDGTEAMLGPLTLVEYTVATLPLASDHPRALVYVSDEAGGAVPVFSDSSNWLRVTDRAAVT